MQSFVYFLALAIGTFAAPIGCPPQQNVTVTTSWHQPPTPSTNGCIYYYFFEIPSNSYGNIYFNAINATGQDSVVIFDSFGTSFDMRIGSGEPVTLKNLTATSINFPSNFYVRVYNVMNTMNVEITVTARQLAQPPSVTQVTTNANKQPTVIYLKDWVVGTSYSFTSKSNTSKIAVAVDPAFVHYTIDELSSLANVFKTEGGVNTGSIFPCTSHICVSKSNQMTLYLAESANLLGAILVTDYENVKGFYDYNVQYVPVGLSSSVSYATANGWKTPGAVTIIGEKNGATPITVRQLEDYNQGGKFSYFSGGPVANYGVVSAPLTNSQLPKTLGGSLNTFLISDNTGSIKYSI